MTNALEPGDLVTERIYFGAALCQVIPARVVRSTDTELIVWVAGGTPVLRRKDPAGRALRDVPRAEWPTGLVPDTWTGTGVVRRYVLAADHAVWWFFDGAPGRFAGWYVNLERHALWSGAGPAGIDVVDQELDGWVTPEHEWHWKDEESFAAKTGDPAFFTAAEAAAVRAEGERVRPAAERGDPPFDGRFCDFLPDPSWPLPERPDAAACERAPALPVGGTDEVPVPD